MKKQNSIMWIQTCQCIVAYELDRSLPKKKIKKKIGLMEKEVGEKFKKNFVRLREKSYIYLKDYDKKDKKQKAQKKVCHRKKT